MLVEELTHFSDILARCMVMRLLDTEEKKLDNDSSGLLHRREQWRQQREAVALSSLHVTSIQQEDKIRTVVRQETSSTSTFETSMEQAAMVVGAVTADSILENVLCAQWLREHVQAPSCATVAAAKRLEKQGKPYRQAVEEHLAALRGTITDDTNGGANTSDSIRSLLLAESCKIRTFVWCWQHVAAATASRAVYGDAVKLLCNALKWYVDAAREQFRTAFHSEGPQGPLMVKRGSSRMSQFQWTTQHQQKWSLALPLVLRMQARARGGIARRRWRPRLQRLAVEAEQQRQQWISSVLLPTATRYMTATQGPLHRYVELTHFITSEEPRLEDYYTNEESRFQKQWNTYTKQLTQFYLQECPLDNDWRVQRQSPTPELGSTGPSPSPPLPASSGNGLIYINVRTGKVQTENPNMLKVVAAKNRQWLKATREREQRAQMMREATAFLNGAKERLRVTEEEFAKVPFFV